MFDNLFFYKQKTAYEMRIIDWSSDVCSSDLNPVIGSPSPETGGQRWRWAGPRLTLHARPWTPLDAEASAPGRHDVDIWSGDAPRHFVLDATEAVGQASEIRRAQGRVRMRQGVEISVGRVLIKKKKTKA